MEIALPHVVVRICGSGVGLDVVSALTTHPVEVSEARDLPELQHVSAGRPANLVVIVDPQDPRAAVAETRTDFPGVPILLVSDSAAAGTAASTSATPGRVDAVSSSQSLHNICWHVMRAISRAVYVPDLTEHPLGPAAIEIDEAGTVLSDSAALSWMLDKGRCLRPGESLLSFVEAQDRATLTRILERSPVTEAEFCSVRLVGDYGGRHAAAIGVRSTGPGRAMLLVQPLIFGAPVVGRHVNTHDPITGLLTRWAISRELESRQTRRAGDRGAIVLLTIEGLSAASAVIGHRHTDEVLVRVASALNEIFPFPAISSRLMGDAFLAFVPDAEADGCRHRAERLIQAVNAIEVPGFSPAFELRASVGLAAMTGQDHDLDLRLAEAAVAEAQAAGGNRTIVAGSAQFTRVQAGELTAYMDRGAWEVWLQPVANNGDGRPEFYESLARFDIGQRRMASRADFFTAGRAAGLLQRFDRMMLQRVLEILESHREFRLSVNVSFETFVSDSFPAAFLDLIRELPGGCERIILEIAPRCMASPADVVGRRLRDLAESGVAVALDDFGSGICRLRYLTQLPLAMVKLDALVTGYVDDDPLQREFVRTVVSLCHARGITTVAEYTRSPEQLARLVEDGVDLFQGKLFGMPRPVAETFAAPPVAGAHA